MFLFLYIHISTYNYWWLHDTNTVKGVLALFILCNMCEGFWIALGYHALFCNIFQHSKWFPQIPVSPVVVQLSSTAVLLRLLTLEVEILWKQLEVNCGGFSTQMV